MGTMTTFIEFYDDQIEDLIKLKEATGAQTINEAIGKAVCFYLKYVSIKQDVNESLKEFIKKKVEENVADNGSRMA